MSDDDKQNLVVLGATAAEVERRKREHARTRTETASEESVDDDPLTLIRKRADLFRDEQGTALAAVRRSGRTELLEIGRRPFELWVRHLLTAAQIHLARSERRDLVEQLESIALFEGRPERVCTRVADAAGGGIYVDLGSSSDEAVRVTADAWSIVPAPPVRFRRAAGTLPLPRPVPGSRGALGELRALLNVEDRQFPLIVGWILAALRPQGPYPVLILQGEQGTAKSTVARTVTALVDPRKVPLRTLPRGERDLAVAAQHAHVLIYDNLSGISAEMSDALCRVSTGGGLATRRLYTDSSEVVLEVSRPVIATGIGAIATRPDLAERSIVVHLPVVASRVAEDVVWSRFDDVAGAVFGTLLDGLVSAVANVDQTHVADLPRMADFAQWVTAAEPGVGWEPGTIVAAFRAAQSEQTLDTFSTDPVAPLIPRVVELGDGRCWAGTASRLLGIVRQLTEHRHGLPRAPNALAAHLGRIAPVLREAGYEVRTERTSAARTIVIERSS